MAQPGSAVFAHHQTRGKGQRNKQWQSAAHQNIAISIIVNPAPLSASQTFLVSMATALAVQRFYQQYAGEETTIKWPNDIYWRDRKTAGILIENTWQGTDWKWCVIGIGININQTKFGEAEGKAVSLKQITGRSFVPLALSKELCTYLQAFLNELIVSPAGIEASYIKALYKLNETVLLKKDGRTFSALIKSVTPQGQLVVQTAVEELFSVGEVEWVI